MKNIIWKNRESKARKISPLDSIVGGEGGKSSKILKAEELAAQGAIVKIIRYEKFAELFNAQTAEG